MATATSEEHEKNKKEYAERIATELIHNFSAEDRFDVFNAVRNELEKQLRCECEEMYNELNHQKERFDSLINIVY